MRPIGNETGAVMSSTALDLRRDYAIELSESHRETGANVCSGQTPAVSARLLDYWRVMLPLPVAARRRALDAVWAATRRDAAVVADMLPFALGDCDDEIVYRATLAHLGPFPRQAGLASTADAIEWVRRRLALNCAAVFAALLSLGDDHVLERLLPLRSTLDADEVAAIRRRLRAECPEAARTFLRPWIDLLDQSCARR
jgi:hypothetical protein